MVISRGILLKGLIGSLAFAGGSLGVVLASRGKNKDDTNSNEVEQDSGSTPQDKNDGNPNVGEGQGTPVIQVDGKSNNSGQNVVSIQNSETPQIATDKEDALGIPLDCKFEQFKNDKLECKLSKEQLKKVKFDMKEGTTTVEVSGLDGENKVDLTVEKPGVGEESNYPKGKKYTLKTSSTTTVTIKGTKDKDITIEKDKDVVLRENESGDKLELVPEVKKDPLGLPDDCKLENENPKECKLDEEKLKKIKFKDLQSSNNVTVSGLDKGKEITLKLEKVKGEESTYPKGIKYIFKDIKQKITMASDGQNINLEEGKEYFYKENGDNKLEKVKEELVLDKFGVPINCKTGIDCELSESDLKKIKFKNLGDSGITVTGLESNKKIKLKKETKDNKYIFKNENGEIKIEDSSKKQTITLKAKAETTFKENDGRLEKISDGEKKNPFGLPEKCNLDEDKKECEISVDDLKKINFSNKGTGELKVTVTEGTPKIKLKKASVEEENKDDFPDKTKYVFDITGGNIDIGEGNNKISLIKNTNPEFKVEKDKLKKAWDAKKLSEKINFECKKDNVSSKCTMFGDTVIKFTNDGTKFENFKPIGDEVFKTFLYKENKSGYNQGIELTPKEDISNNNIVQLSKNSSYEIKYKSGKDSGWYLFKKNG